MISQATGIKRRFCEGISMTSESYERVLPQECVDSPSIDDANSNENVEPNAPLKKGPWTPAEDAILFDYVTKHGEGNWNAVQKNSGLVRCGKSCRLRWTNHLRPDLKKGAFSHEEEQHVIELHANMGNKWARMAAELPGRTDNEIKNFWNTRIKRRHKAGLPIYPNEISSQLKTENQQCDKANSFLLGDMPQLDLMPVNELEMLPFVDPELGLQKLYPPSLCYIPSSNNFPAIPSECLQSCYHDKSLLRSTNPSKRLCGPKSHFSGLNSPIGEYGLNGDISVQSFQSLLFSSPYDHNSPSDHLLFSSLFSSNDATLNTGPSSEPTLAMKLELPSLQNPMGIQDSSTLLKYEGIPIYTPQDLNACNYTTSHSGLLDAVLYQSEAIRMSNYSFPQASHVVTTNVTNSSTQNLKRDKDDEFVSSFLNSTSTNENIFDEFLCAGMLINEEPSKDAASLQLPGEINAYSTDTVISRRPDYLLASNYLPPIRHMKHDFAIESHLNDDMKKELKKVYSGTPSMTQSYSKNGC